MNSFLQWGLLILAAQVFSVSSLAIDQSFNTSVESQATLYERQDPGWRILHIKVLQLSIQIQRIKSSEMLKTLEQKASTG
jgi:hypothetical protein